MEEFMCKIRETLSVTMYGRRQDEVCGSCLCIDSIGPETLIEVRHLGAVTYLNKRHLLPLPPSNVTHMIEATTNFGVRFPMTIKVLMGHNSARFRSRSSTTPFKVQTFTVRSCSILRVLDPTDSNRR